MDKNGNVRTNSSQNWLTLTAILLLLFLVSRFYYFSPDVGYRSQSADIFNHYFVVESILHGEVFPDWNKTETAEHAVSNYLPLYHGLIGSHILVATLVALGLPLPGSVLLLSDLAFVLLLLLFYFTIFSQTSDRICKYISFLTAVFAAFYIYAIQNYGAFFSQTVGMAVGLLSILAVSSGIAPKKSLILLLGGAICYPDAILFLLPMVAWQTYQRKMKVFSFLYMILWLCLCIVFASRFKLPGSFNFDLSALLTLLVVASLSKFFLNGLKDEKLNLIKKITMSYLVVFALMTMFSFYQVSGISYYLNKFAVWSYVLFPIVLSQIIDWKRQVLALFIFVLLFTSGLLNNGESGVAIAKFVFQSRSANLSNSAWSEIRQLFDDPEVESKKTAIPWVAEKDRSGMMQPMEAILAITRSYNLTSGVVNSEILRKYGSGEFKETKNLHLAYKEVAAGGRKTYENLLDQLNTYPSDVLVVDQHPFETSALDQQVYNLRKTDHYLLIWKK